MKTITKEQRIKESKNLIDAAIRHMQEGGIPATVSFNTQSEDEPLLPPGYTQRPDGSIESPVERQERLLKKQRQEQQTRTRTDGDALYPVGIDVE